MKIESDRSLYVGFRASDAEMKRALERVGDTMGISSMEQVMRMVCAVFLEDFEKNEDRTTSRGFRHLKELNAIARQLRQEARSPTLSRRKPRRP